MNQHQHLKNRILALQTQLEIALDRQALPREVSEIHDQIEVARMLLWSVREFIG